MEVLRETHSQTHPQDIAVEDFFRQAEADIEKDRRLYQLAVGQGIELRSALMTVVAIERGIL